MKIEGFIDVPAGTPITHDLQLADGKILLVLGSPFDRADPSTLHLTFDDPEMLTRLAQVALAARAVLMGALDRQLPPGQTTQVLLPGYLREQSTNVSGTFDQLGPAADGEGQP